MTDPRPAEGPDREALQALVNRWQIRANVSDDRRVAYMLRFCADELTAVLALLPSPPAPGGECSRRCSEMHRYDAGCVLGPALGNERLTPESGQRRSDLPLPPAPGGGDTDLRAAARAVSEELHRLCDRTTTENPRIPPSDVRVVANRLDRALAARPDADRDALARAVQAEVARCEERVTESVAYTLPWLNRAFVAGVNASRQVTARHLRAALARDAEGSGQ